MSTPTLETDQALPSNYWLENRSHLFLASCIALIVTAMSFAIRGDLINTFSNLFHLTKGEVGWVVLAAFWGFVAAMVIGGPLCDVLGMGKLLTIAFFGHLAAVILTIVARDFWTLLLSVLVFGLANGFVEAACNPLVATLYPDQKVKRLNLFHVWFPGGIVIGGVIAYFIDQWKWGGEAHGWQIKMASMLIPLAVYGVMFLGRKFPATERLASGVSSGEMLRECFRPFFLLFVCLMMMTAITELGPQQWFPTILTRTTGVQGILFLIWITGLMAVGRTLGGPIAHKISPTGMLIVSSLFAAIGLYMISIATSAGPAFAAATIFAVGVCFFWPTMLGFVSERFPKTGSLGLAIMGGVGMFASGTIQPIIGRTYDEVAARTAGLTMEQYAAAGKNIPDMALAAGGVAALQRVLILPIILIVAFTAVYIYDRSRGGYKKEVLVQHQ